MTEMIYPGNLFFGNKVDAVYDVLAYMSPGLYLDVGAAAGKVTRKIASYSGSRVISFEPFEGNIEHFRRNTNGLSNVTLKQTAVSDFDGQGRLFVAAKLKGDERGWESYAGYSSSGTLISQEHPKWKDVRTGEVSVCSIDASVNENVRLMKIDVQGGEAGVLHGAERTIDQYGIDLIYVEFEGDEEIIRFLGSKGYTLFDSGIYVYSPKAGDPPAESLSTGFKTSRLSSGREVFKGPLTKRPLDVNEYTAFINSLSPWALQTDLIAVHRSVLPEFLAASARWMQSEISRIQDTA